MVQMVSQHFQPVLADQILPQVLMTTTCVQRFRYYFSFTVTLKGFLKPADATLKSLLRLIRALESAFS